MPPNQGLPPPPPPTGDEDDECVSSKDLHAMINVMIELFTKNHQSKETSLERVEHSIVGVLDQVGTLETRLPSANQAKHATEETHEEDYNEEEEPFNPPCPPPRRQYQNE
jgi:hypothetical protein